MENIVTKLYRQKAKLMPPLSNSAQALLGAFDWPVTIGLLTYLLARFCCGLWDYRTDIYGNWVNYEVDGWELTFVATAGSLITVLFYSFSEYYSEPRCLPKLALSWLFHLVAQTARNLHLKRIDPNDPTIIVTAIDYLQDTVIAKKQSVIGQIEKQIQEAQSGHNLLAPIINDLDAQLKEESVNSSIVDLRRARLDQARNNDQVLDKHLGFLAEKKEQAQSAVKPCLELANQLKANFEVAVQIEVIGRTANQVARVPNEQELIERSLNELRDLVLSATDQLLDIELQANSSIAAHMEMGVDPNIRDEEGQKLKLRQ